MVCLLIRNAQDNTLSKETSTQIVIPAKVGIHVGRCFRTSGILKFSFFILQSISVCLRGMQEGMSGCGLHLLLNRIIEIEN
jgi:hypothetical protein